ncbi:MAG: hypothetical protein IPJ89_03155 [Candidatus Iainarchaeum archaeon]|uniref:Uncharacterized protein n=1 Tax=Candidatus Iainarchaeum sp. TaxID=3101447 RepID=A0A7T9I1L2_9ARCH|nr:MAG: hypothetical protein IPJ89_03155 [Candidatus Diapherotrites archaeon]
MIPFPSAPSPDKKGFVLSFALFILALYIVVYAQLQASHLHELRANEYRVWQQTRAAQLSADLRLDLNALLNQSLVVDQNDIGVNLFLRGSLPSDLNVYTNLLRYQSQIQKLGQDSNIVAWLDLNAFVQDLNIIGRTDHNTVWKQPIDMSRITIYSEQSSNFPEIIDINIHSNREYVTLTPWTLDASGDTYIRFRFEDSNSGHDFTATGWGSVGNDYTYLIDFNTTPSSYIALTFGTIDENRGSLRIQPYDSSDMTPLQVDYSIRWQTAADATPVRAGYDLPLSIMGKDINVIQSTQWVYE